MTQVMNAEVINSATFARGVKALLQCRNPHASSRREHPRRRFRTGAPSGVNQRDGSRNAWRDGRATYRRNAGRSRKGIGCRRTPFSMGSSAGKPAQSGHCRRRRNRSSGMVASVAPQKVQAAEHELVRPAGIEPATPAFGEQCSTFSPLRTFKNISAFVSRFVASFTTLTPQPHTSLQR